jgi:hypothetical protein
MKDFSRTGQIIPAESIENDLQCPQCDKAVTESIAIKNIPDPDTKMLVGDFAITCYPCGDSIFLKREGLQMSMRYSDTIERSYDLGDGWTGQECKIVVGFMKIGSVVEFGTTVFS